MSKKTQTQEGQAVGTAVSSFESFLKSNQKLLTTIILAILIIIFAIFAINKWYLSPLKEEAKAQMFPAEQFFRADSFETALNGDGNIMGFTQIIDQYGNKAGKAVYLYAGICELQLGNNEKAVSYLTKYKGSDEILKGRALSCIGDAYSNLGENAKALNYYTKAAKVADNMYAAQYLFKAGIISEEIGNKDQALKFYEEISVKYPQTFEGYQVNKYISRIKNTK
ncbi:MAG: tetratricopeptide repeat protein [Bacteroidales bacterium]|nr:tetratricopeptide repeat protein [Bacteroidales bacterium]MDD4670164.1 tetratricopeptide repeat protein [Bacteroidales bacterium]